MSDDLPTLKQMCALFVAVTDIERCRAELSDARTELSEARNEAHCCDDINLDQPLAGIIADLEKDRTELRDEVKEVRAILARIHASGDGVW